MELKNKIKSKIIFKDLRLDKFISNALYSEHGYYLTKNPIGNKKDFYTAPEVSQMFGEIIGLYLYYIWKTKINSKFNFIELGPGKGTLFEDIARSVNKYPDFLRLAKIYFIEINKKLIKLQKNKFKKLNLNNSNWSNKINYRSKIPSIIYCNEFFDCFPVRQFVYNNLWDEKYVSFNKIENKFYFKNKSVRSNKLISLLNLYKNKKILEISFSRKKYFEKICKFIKKNRGLLFAIDYGHFGDIKNFTLQAVRNHKFTNVLENIGETDISSHVDFNELITVAKINNLKIEECCTQRDFLIKYGIFERRNNLIKKNNQKKIDLQLEKLIGKKEMGELFKCIIISNL